MRLTHAIRRRLRARGWDVVRFSHDQSLFAYVPMLIDRLRIDTVVDVGAHVGVYAGRLRAEGFRGRLVCFEPQARSFAALEHAALGDRHWTAHQLALGARTERRTLRGSGVMASLLPARPDTVAWQAAADGAQAEVQVTRLDEVLPTILPDLDRRRLFLKLDTQGFDLEVVRGAAGCLDRVEAMQVEMSILPQYEGAPMWPEAVGFLREAGYAISALFPVSRDRQLRLIEFDAVMVRDRADELHPTPPNGSLG